MFRLHVLIGQLTSNSSTGDTFQDLNIIDISDIHFESFAELIEQLGYQLLAQGEFKSVFLSTNKQPKIPFYDEESWIQLFIQFHKETGLGEEKARLSTQYQRIILHNEEDVLLSTLESE